MFENVKRVLVVSAHPDDEVLGAGATLAKLSKQGKEVYSMVLGEGITSRSSRRQDADKIELKQLKKQSRQAAQVLGVKETFFFDFADNRFDSVDLIDIVKAVDKIIDKVKPDILFTHHPADLNIDHQRTFQAVLVATRPIHNSIPKQIYSFYIPSSSEWSFNSFGEFKANTYVDVTDSISSKLKALECYKNEVRKFPHPRSLEIVEAMSKVWGSHIGVKAAEAFQLIRGVFR